jgi:3-oxoacyl-[acyl-carrier-protein] synthase II
VKAFARDGAKPLPPPPASAAASPAHGSPAPVREPLAGAGLMSFLRRARLLSLLGLRRGLSSSSPASEAGPFPPPRTGAGRRVVVTGLGAVTPLGRGVGRAWGRLVSGECATRALAAEDLRLPGDPAAARSTLEQLTSRVVGTVPRGKGEAEFDDEAWTKVWCFLLTVP